MFVLPQTRSCQPHIVCFYVFLMVALDVPVMADDDSSKSGSLTPRFPRSRSRSGAGPDEKEASALGLTSPTNRRSDSSNSNADSGNVELPTIVTPRDGRRPIVLESTLRANELAIHLRPPAPDVQIDPNLPWHLETLVLKDETEYQGLLLRTTIAEAEFAQIRRQPGRPMSAIVRVIPRERVKRFDGLPADQRDMLTARYYSFRRRARIEARNLEMITLHPLAEDERQRFVYEGQWFQLVSSADDESTRRCVIRIEQMFGGFRQVVAPRVEPPGRLRFVLFGSMDEFRSQLRSWKLDIKNPAIYSPAQNMIAAGGDLSRFGAQLATIRRDHEALLRRFEEFESEFQQGLVSLRAELVSGGFQPDEIKAELVLRRTRWRESQARLRRDIQAANRRNDALFASMTSQMLKRLYHEGFHAYLENFVFPHREYHVDRWLNEGLAQIFENGRFDVEVLRLDAPDPDLLAKLQADLASTGRMRLVELLTAPESAFLARHDDDNADRRYLYAWGVAYYLAFEQGLFDGDALENYVVPLQGRGGAPSAAATSDVARFELLVGRKIPDFEARWRDFILKLQPAT